MNHLKNISLQTIELKPGGADEPVTIHNLEEYIER